MTSSTADAIAYLRSDSSPLNLEEKSIFEAVYDHFSMVLVDAEHHEHYGGTGLPSEAEIWETQERLRESAIEREEYFNGDGWDTVDGLPPDWDDGECRLAKEDIYTTDEPIARTIDETIAWYLRPDAKSGELWRTFLTDRWNEFSAYVNMVNEYAEILQIQSQKCQAIKMVNEYFINSKDWFYHPQPPQSVDDEDSDVPL